MTSLLIAVVSASLLGSLHCAGMCGPFALYAASDNGRVRTSRLTAYHAGRLFTYLIIGVLVGFTGQVVDASGQAVGLPQGASQVAGALLIALAILRLWPHRTPGDVSPGVITRWIARTRPAIQKLPVSLRPAGIGAVTVLLPCGWLYAFAIVAAGSGSVTAAVLVMTAFWVGTVPWLSGLTLLAKPLNARPIINRVVTASLLAAAGLYTMTGRAVADFAPLIDQAAANQSQVETLDAVTELPPPCCRVAGDSDSEAETSEEPSS